MELNIEKNGYSSYEIEAHGEEQLHIHVDKHISASLMITYSGIEAILHTSLHLAQGSSLTLMMKDEMTKTIQLDIKGEVMKDASLHVALCELNQGNSNVDATIVLKQSGAYAMFRSACIVESEKHFDINCIHDEAYTIGLMENYAVVKKGGNYRMKATGTIVKGAHDSSSRQATRVLTLSADHVSDVIPVLIIDENDVKASHAATLGQPDENQLYYLQTRGLSRSQALGLLTIGYVMPITQLFDNEEVNRKLKDEIEMKVGLHA